MSKIFISYSHRCNGPRHISKWFFELWRQPASTRLPDYRMLLLTLPEIGELDQKDAAEICDYLLANPLRSVINGGRERYLIVLDAWMKLAKPGAISW